MELGARNLGLTSELLDCMDGIEYEYVCTDASSYYLNQAKKNSKIIPEYIMRIWI